MAPRIAKLLKVKHRNMLQPLLVQETSAVNPAAAKDRCANHHQQRDEQNRNQNALPLQLEDVRAVVKVGDQKVALADNPNHVRSHVIDVVVQGDVDEVCLAQDDIVTPARSVQHVSHRNGLDMMIAIGGHVHEMIVIATVSEIGPNGKENVKGRGTGIGNENEKDRDMVAAVIVTVPIETWVTWDAIALTEIDRIEATGGIINALTIPISNERNKLNNLHLPPLQQRLPVVVALLFQLHQN